MVGQGTWLRLGQAPSRYPKKKSALRDTQNSNILEGQDGPSSVFLETCRSLTPGLPEDALEGE